MPDKKDLPEINKAKKDSESVSIESRSFKRVAENGSMFNLLLSPLCYWIYIFLPYIIQCNNDSLM